MLLILLVLLSVVALYVKLSNNNKYWLKRGVKQGSPVPIFGDKIRILSHNEPLSSWVQKIYNYAPDDRYCGVYDFMAPALVLRDPDLIKDILVKNFDHFVDHKRVIPEGSDPIWDKNLFFLTGQKWREMRSILTPLFTGTKMRHMFGLLTKSARQFVDYFEHKNEEVIEVELKDTFARLTNDIIASTVFGFDCDSLRDRSGKFYEMAKRITDFGSLWLGVKLLGFFIFPTLYKTLKIKILPGDVSGFFYKIVRENIQSRRSKGIVRPDMINLLMEAKELHKEITDEDITAQALVFFFAGFDSVSSLMCFMSYELALNPDVQDKLRQEIQDSLLEMSGQVTYESVHNLKYMDMVVSESLRKWPITPFVNRVCTIPYTIDAKTENEQPIHFKTNDIAILPIYALHWDPKHFPEPHRFDPDRFSDENKEKIDQYTFLPFGTGPRKCIGYRFALLEVKIIFFYLLSQFEIVPIDKTEIPVTLSKTALNMTPEHGLWVGFKRLNSS